MSVFIAGFLFTQIVHCYIDKYSGIEDAVLDIKHGNTVREKDTATPPASYTNLPEILSSIGHVSWLGCAYLHVCAYCLTVVH